ncbi:hypothetical protein [Microlunatus parietis]|uniref:Uncharacterized protein n=1 Tax=Microlunatus parietis TaxID=682979 RepID=A0A7Y9ID16_9ACTN|nr:hypothetical protein [Microlunatus parietis]NYE74059.1 hypothetical protein [Microlunatus parietis]
MGDDDPAIGRPGSGRAESVHWTTLVPTGYGPVGTGSRGTGSTTASTTPAPARPTTTPVPSPAVQRRPVPAGRPRRARTSATSVPGRTSRNAASTGINTQRGPASRIPARARTAPPSAAIRIPVRERSGQPAAECQRQHGQHGEQLGNGQRDQRQRLQHAPILVRPRTRDDRPRSRPGYDLGPDLGPKASSPSGPS